ncbi:LOW QUALITY PROTEIN: serine protease 23-like [Ciconia maguari]
MEWGAGREGGKLLSGSRQSMQVWRGPASRYRQILFPTGDQLVEWSCGGCWACHDDLLPSALLLLSFLPSGAAGDLVPTLVPQSMLQLAKGRFLSQPVPELTTCCNCACTQQETALVLDFQEYLFKTVYPNSTRTLTVVEVSPWASGAERRRQRRRVQCKQQIYGTDRQSSISGNQFRMNYPFPATKISMGCVGTLVSERHVLTAVRCTHDSKDYMKGAKKIKVGFLMPVQGAFNRMGMGRLVMRWAWVQYMQVPMGWIWGPNSVSMDYDYAFLELCRPHQRPHMKLMTALAAEEMAGKRIPFSGFDSDQPGKLVYRFCGVEDEMVHLIYQHCNARPGVSSAGVYGKVWDPVGHKWKRKVMRVFSGHQWLEVAGEHHSYNVAVCLIALKFAQICYWIKGDSKSCCTE